MWLLLLLQVIIGDTFSSLAAFYLGPESVLAQRQTILLVLGLGVCLPLCIPRNLSALGKPRLQVCAKRGGRCTCLSRMEGSPMVFGGLRARQLCGGLCFHRLAGRMQISDPILLCLEDFEQFVKFAKI